MTTIRLSQRAAPSTIPFANCHISAAARAGALDVMAGGWMTAGERTQEFEHQFAAFVAPQSEAT